jgi:hypothetical protein
MALRGGRGARLRRAAGGRAGFVALALALYLLAGATATWPASRHLRSAFLAGGASGYGEPAPGDHLQTGYRLWLVGHQLEHGRAPWVDPYSFRPEARPQLNYAGWPFGLVAWPFYSAFGPVVGWNLFVLLSYGLAGALACAWLRELGLPRGPALVGGLAFALAPYRVEQSTGHLLGPISVLLPAALWAFERARRGSLWWSALAAAALGSIPLSGQVHLALGAIPFFLGYAVVRSSERRVLLASGAGIAVAVAAGVLVDRTQIASSINATGRSLAEVSSYSAQWLDLVTRHQRHGNESFVFLGWLTPLLALIGLGALARARRFGLAVLLGLGAVLPVVLALGTNEPLYRPLFHVFPPFRYPRVPERLLPVACLALAALVAFAVARLRVRFVVVLLLLVSLVADLHVHAYGASAADERNRVYGYLRGQPPGRLLELPAFDPGTHYGGVYLYYDEQALRQRPEGYSTVAPTVSRTIARALIPLGCGEWPPGAQLELGRLGVRELLLHLALFRQPGVLPQTSWFAWRGLLRHGWDPVYAGANILLLEHRRTSLRPSFREPNRQRVWLCGGWGQKLPDRSRSLDEPHVGLWFYGRFVQLRLLADQPATVSVSTEGRRFSHKLSGSSAFTVGFVGRRWHLLALDAPETALAQLHLQSLQVYR